MGIFKACDIRGIYPEEINEDIVYKIGRATGAIYTSQRIIVAGDVRLSTETLRTALVDGLRTSGSNVIDIGIVPTPVFYYARKLLGVENGIMITASHNPPDYNGLKLAFGTLPITEKQMAQIRDVARSGAYSRIMGSLSSENVLDRYETYISETGSQLLRDVNKIPRVVLDCGSGCYSDIAPRVFRNLGIRRKKLFCEADGAFPDRSPDCADSKALSFLCDEVIREKADLGIAFDGDGDRAAYVDETGKILTAEQFISIIGKYGVGVGHGDKVVLDIKCGSAAVEVLKSTGADVISEKSGHTFIKTKMIQENCIFGGEVSGHLFYRELGGGDDGLYSALLMTSIVGKYGSLSRLASDLPTYCITPDIRIKTESAPDIIEKIASSFPEDMVSRLDGVKVKYPNGWGLARSSVTEPAITLRFEGHTKADLDEVMNRFLVKVPELKESISRKLASSAKNVIQCAED